MGELKLAAVQLQLAQAAPDVTNYERHRIDARLDDVNDEIAKLGKTLEEREREEQRRRR